MHNWLRNAAAAAMHSNGGRDKKEEEEEEEEEVSYSPDLGTLISYFPFRPLLRRPRFRNELERELPNL